MNSKTSFKTYFRWLGYFFIGVVFLLGVAFAIAYINRDEIKQRILSALNENINGTVSAEKIHFTIIHQFPDFSVTLREVTLHDSVGGKPVFRAEKVFIDAGLYALLRGEIHMDKVSVENGEIFLYRAMDGYTNASAFKSKPDTATAQIDNDNSYKLNLRDVSFRNLTVQFIDSLKGKRISVTLLDTDQILIRQDSVTDLSIAGKMHCNELTFNADAGGYLENQEINTKIRLQLDHRVNSLRLMPSTLQLKEDRIDVEGEFLLGDSSRFALHIKANDLLLEHGRLYVNERIRSRLEQFSVDRPVILEVVIRGSLKRGLEPEADVSFAAKNANFAFQKLRLQEVACSGKYLHRPDSTSARDEKSMVIIDKFRLTLEGVPFEGNVSLVRLYDPVMDLRTRSKFSSATFNQLVDTAEWISRSGSFTSSVKYKGRLEEYLDTKAAKYRGRLSGEFRVTGGSFEYKPKKYRLENVYGSCHFSEKQFAIDSLRLKVNGSIVRLSGTMRNYIPFFIQPANKGFVTLKLHSPRLDLSFIASEKAKTNLKRDRDADQRKITSVINAVQRKLQFDVSVSADEIIYKKFTARNLTGEVTLDGNLLEASNIKMKVAGGEMATRFVLRGGEGDRKFLSVNTRIKDADISEFFLMFNNFNQRTIGAENLVGSISATANFSSDVFPDYTVDAPSMKGNIRCRIRDGRLVNFEPLENLSNFLFRKRDFSDVEFAELESYFDINGTNLDIERMEVQSSVLSFFIQGRYSFTDSTSMSLQLPLNNLKKRDRDFKPENVGTDAKRGMSVYLHVFRDKDINSKINIAYDPFKKWTKASSR